LHSDGRIIAAAVANDDEQRVHAGDESRAIIPNARYQQRAMRCIAADAR
jgi:hypothetical protein